jgi:hypothetical protein
MSVIKIVVKHKVGISISSKPDYSDYLDAKGVPHPRTAAAAGPPIEAAGMPDVTPCDDLEQVFTNARETAAGSKGARGLVVVAADRQLLLVPALEPSKKLNEVAAGMERLVPSAVKRNIAVIANTRISAATPDAFNIADANRAIPFLGLLTGLTYIGHRVWIFEGHATALAAGCRDADILIVDSGMAPYLENRWEKTVSAAMRNPNILIHDRANLQTPLRAQGR